eukprot:IDg10583t1
MTASNYDGSFSTCCWSRARVRLCLRNAPSLRLLLRAPPRFSCANVRQNGTAARRRDRARARPGIATVDAPTHAFVGIRMRA